MGWAQARGGSGGPEGTRRCRLRRTTAGGVELTAMSWYLP